MLRLAYSERFPLRLPPGHRFPIQKYELVRRQLGHEGVEVGVFEAVFSEPGWTDFEVELAGQQESHVGPPDPGGSGVIPVIAGFGPESAVEKVGLHVIGIGAQGGG